jgi:hypothetical protein
MAATTMYNHEKDAYGGGTHRGQLTPSGGGMVSGGGMYDDDNDGSNPTTNREMRRSRRVTFYKNGDKYFPGKLVTITPSRYYSFRELMGDLNRSVDLPYGVRRVYTPVSGREIYDIEELHDGSSYVAASFEPFRATKYGDNSRTWNPCKLILFLIFNFSP